MLVIVAVIIICVLIGGCLFYRDLTRGPLPQHDGEISVKGLHNTVEILRDEWGVPHIYAQNMHDLFFAQGYTQAQDRWWQMEFWRHIGSGTIGEITGRDDDILETDIMIRTLGWREVAEQEVDLCDEETMAHLQAFADGVNAYISSRNSGDLAIEYGVLRLIGKHIEVEPWTVADSLVWGKVMAWDLGPRGFGEKTRSIIDELVGQEMADQWMTPPWPYGYRQTIVQSEDLDIATQINGINESNNQSDSNDEPQYAGYGNLNDGGFVFGTSRGTGSNNWVVSGSMTQSGMPLLANDPHLGIQSPSIWYEIGLHCASGNGGSSFDVTGFTFATIPGVVIGHNSDIAWGVTNTGPDVSDLYRIRVNPDNPLQYEWMGDWRDMTLREETIHFAGSDDIVTVQVRETHIGPIINDNELDEDTGEVLGFNNVDPLALRWVGSEPSIMTQAFFGINKATNWMEFRDSLQYWDIPSQNFIYADIEGNIGYQMPGRIPIRYDNHSGLTPVPGWTDEYEWQGYIPFEYLPHVFNPEQGYIATANQAVVSPEYYDWLEQELGADRNYVFSLDWDYGYRAQRIVELLEATTAHTIDSYQLIQGDNKLISAEEITPYLAALELDDELAESRDWLLDWDFTFDIDSPQAALYAQFWARLMENLFNDQLADERLEKEHKAYGSDRDMWATALLLQEPDNAWWDHTATEGFIETRDDILLQSFQEGYENAVAALGRNPGKWRWGDLHKATFVSNPLGASGVGLIEGRVNRGPFSVGGSMATINNTAWGVGSDEDFEVLWLPSMRMIVDLSDLTKSVTVHTTGQSGHPYSSHYDDMIELWRDIEYHSMLWSPDQVDASSEAILTLYPESG